MTFDPLGASTSDDVPHIRPWWSFDFDSKKEEKKLHDALVRAHSDLEDYQEETKYQQLQHLALYKGIHIDSRSLKEGRDRLSWETLGRRGSSSVKAKKIIINHLRDITDSAVARLATFKPSVTVLPTHGSEFKDKAKAKVTESWLKTYIYANDIDEFRRIAQRHAFIFGEAYALIEWDEEAGDPIEGLKGLAKTGKTITIQADGEEIEVSPAERTGDVTMKMVLPFRVFPEPVASHRWGDVQWVMTEEWEYVEKVKSEYPDVANKIKVTNEQEEEMSSLFAERKQQQQVKVITLWHKATREVPNGRMIRFTRDVTLENEDLPYSHGELPIERLTSLDVPGELHGRSPFQDLKELQGSINQLYSIMIRDRSMAAPKLFMPKGSFSRENMKANTPGVIEYQGGVLPTWSVPNLVSNDLMNMIEKLENTLEKLSNSLGTRRGDSLPNVEAFKAFGFFEEQATKRDSTQIAKHRMFLERLFKKILFTAADFYSQDDGRMIKMLGKNNQYLLESFDVEDLQQAYDIQVQNASFLPDSKAGRIQALIQLNQALPNTFTEAKVADLLDSASVDAFYDLSSKAVNAAEQENEKMMQGVEPKEPQRFEDLLAHWEAHRRQLDDPTIKETLPEDPALANMMIEAAISGAVEVDLIMENPFENKDTQSPALLLIKHQHITEGLMYERALKNASFAQKLLDPQFEAFPIFLEMPVPLSQILMGHQSPQEAIQPPTGVDQEVQLPLDVPNPNDLIGGA